MKDFGPIAHSTRANAVTGPANSIGPKTFTDLLTLIFTRGQWWIISKVFHYDLALAPA